MATDRHHHAIAARSSLSATSGSLIGTLDALESAGRAKSGLLNQLDEHPPTNHAHTRLPPSERWTTLKATSTTLSSVAALSSSQTLRGKSPNYWSLNAASINGSPYPSERNDRRISDRQLWVRCHAVLHNLALWVDGFVLMAIYKLEVDRTTSAHPQPPTQGYLGRWLLFATVGPMQAIIATVGDILGINAHPMLFISQGLLRSVRAT